MCVSVCLSYAMYGPVCVLIFKAFYVLVFNEYYTYFAVSVCIFYLCVCVSLQV